MKKFHQYSLWALAVAIIFALSNTACKSKGSTCGSGGGGCGDSESAVNDKTRSVEYDTGGHGQMKAEIVPLPQGPSKVKKTKGGCEIIEFTDSAEALQELLKTGNNIVKLGSKNCGACVAQDKDADKLECGAGNRYIKIDTVKGQHLRSFVNNTTGRIPFNIMYKGGREVGRTNTLSKGEMEAFYKGDSEKLVNEDQGTGHDAAN